MVNRRAQDMSAQDIFLWGKPLGRSRKGYMLARDLYVHGMSVPAAHVLVSFQLLSCLGARVMPIWSKADTGAPGPQSVPGPREYVDGNICTELAAEWNRKRSSGKNPWAREERDMTRFSKT